MEMPDIGQAVADLQQRPEVHVPPLFQPEGSFTPSALKYFAHYGLDSPEMRHDFGSFDCGDQHIVAHLFQPAQPRATVFVLHGYLDHVGIQRHLLHGLLAEGHAVALFDLPGHGLSSGARASIDDFQVYVDALRAFVALCRHRAPPPHHFVGHSTGGAVIVDHLLRGGNGAAGRVALLAPLIQSYGWRLSDWAQGMAGRFLRQVPRVFRANSSDAEFLRFVRRDPLQPRYIPLAWHQALKVWQGRIEGRPASDQEMLIVQGTKDTTVDGPYNAAYLRGKFPRAQVELIRGARHHLLNEASPWREQVLQRVLLHLDR